MPKVEHMTTPFVSAQYTIRAADFEPAYLALHRRGELLRRAKAAVASLAECRVCPRLCGVDRLGDKTATCKTGRYAQYVVLQIKD